MKALFVRRSRRCAPWLLLLMIVLALMPASWASADDCINVDYEVQAGPLPYNDSTYGVAGDAKPRYAYVHYTPPALYTNKVESIFIIKPSLNWIVEVGWRRIAYPTYQSEPVFLGVYVFNGTYMEHNWENPWIVLPAEQWKDFRVASDGTTWRWYMNDEVKWTKTFSGFTLGYSGGMGERHNSCTSIFARWMGLEKKLVTSWTWQPWTSMYQIVDTDPYAKLCILAGNDFKVRDQNVNCSDP